MTARKVPEHPLEARYPEVAHFLGTTLIGDEGFEEELNGAIRGNDDEWLPAITEDLRRILADSTLEDDALTSFVDRYSAYLIDGSGRRTLEAALAHYDEAIRNPKPRHWLAPRVPTLTRLLYEHTRSTDDLDGLVREGARALGPEAVRAARAEITALLDDPTLSDRELRRFIRVHSYWLVASNGRLTLERIAAALDAVL